MVLVPWGGDDDGPPPPAPARRARLFLVQPGASLPRLSGCLDDWVRLPAAEDEVEARSAALQARLALHERGRERPRMDELGVLYVGSRWVDLPPIEARLCRVLVANLGHPVPTPALLEAGWGPGGGTSSSIRIQVLRLRRRLAPVGLAIHALPRRGYLLDWADPAPVGAT
ncbi:MAG TPA: helix-turn-helix domain-containing protein [Acidimicrobiales bacterium]|nr:helix-turn-helix domain-containing protein [Acidimicrobiales bacterium]